MEWDAVILFFSSLERAVKQFLKHLCCIISFLHFDWVRCHTATLECFQEMKLEGLERIVFSNSIHSVVSCEDIPTFMNLWRTTSVPQSLPNVLSSWNNWSLQCFFPEAQEHCCTLPWLPAVVWAPSGAHRGGCVSLVALLLQLPCTKKQVPITSKTQTQCWLCKYPFFNLSLCLCLFFQVYFQLHTKLHGIFRKL